MFGGDLFIYSKFKSNLVLLLLAFLFINTFRNSSMGRTDGQSNERAILIFFDMSFWVNKQIQLE